MQLELFLPVKPRNILQPFGTNGAYYRSHGINIVGHNGIDLQASHGQPIYAAHDGTAYYEYDDKQGEGVVLRTTQPYDYNGKECFFKTIYWHMCDPIKEPHLTSPIYAAVGYKPDQTGVSQVGVAVKAGDLLGYADNTGLSTGDHLHFSLKPQAAGEPPGTWVNVAQTNGYLGAIDPTPYLNGRFAEDIKLAEEAAAITKTAAELLPEIAAATDIPAQTKAASYAAITDFLKSLWSYFFKGR